jgi:ribosomal protein S18 acetylase RimI-like enzyme
MSDTGVRIEKVKAFSPEIAASLRYLAEQLGKNYQELTDEALKEMLSYPTHTIFIARDLSTNEVAGMILCMVYRIPYVRKAYIDDLVVDSKFRGQGIATQLMSAAVAFAKENGAAYVDFTSRPLRGAGNTLYEKLGFVKRDTNVYRILFNYGKV